MQVKIDDVSGLWVTTIDVTATEREKGTMKLTLDYLGVGMAAFTGHPEITAPLRAEFKDGRLTLTGADVAMTGKAKKSGSTFELEGTYTIGGRKGDWYALYQPGTRPDKGEK